MVSKRGNVLMVISGNNLLLHTLCLQEAANQNTQIKEEEDG